MNSEDHAMQLDLTASDGHTFSAYRANAKGATKGGLVVIQEIFGVNSHIRSVCDRYAADGFTCIAPALFDRVNPGIELGYEADDIAKGRDLKGKVSDEEALRDIQACIDVLTNENLATATVGYCWGGSLTWLSATRLTGIKAAVSYYGGQVPDQADEKPNVPVMFHFGETDASIPLDRVEIVRQKQPDLPLHIYPAGHGFSCDARGSFDAASADLAKERTLAFFASHL